MIYVQPQISCTLPLKLFERRKDLIVSDIIEIMTVERSIGHANTKLNTMQSTHIHVYIQTHTQTHTHTNIDTYIPTIHTDTHIHTHTSN